MYCETHFEFDGSMAYFKKAFIRNVWQTMSGSINRDNPIKPYQRNHWKTFYEAKKSREQLLDNPGMYIFGCNTVVVYLGQTSRGNQTFSTRFSRRYMGDKDREQRYRNAEIETPQFLIAHEYQSLLKQENGWQEFQKKYPAVYSRIANNHGGNPPTRIRHAERLAREGMENVWFALWPCLERANIEFLEMRLISTADKYNKYVGDPKLLNAQHLGFEW